MRRTAIKRAASCEGKERFVSFTRAARVARLAASRREERLRAYHCRYCGGFHVGTPSPRVAG